MLVCCKHLRAGGISRSADVAAVTAFLLLSLMVIPASVGIVLGIRARRLGERRLGTTGVVVNTLVASYLVVTAAAFLMG